MTWAHAALVSAAILAIVSVLDSHLVSRRFPGFRQFLLLVGTIHMGYAVLLSLLVPLPDGIGSAPVGWAVLSSLIRTGAIILLLDALRRRDVSSVVPVVYAYPMWVAVIAVVVLGETLAWQQWLAVVIVASGAVLISLNVEPSLTQLERPRSALILLATVLFALADVTGKVALEHLSFWNLFWIGAAVMGATFLAVALRPGVVRGIAALPDRRGSIALLAVNEVIAPVGIVISYWALQHGPVSLVSTLLSARPLFVLVYALLLGAWMPGFLLRSGGRRLVTVRVVATLMIVGGIAVIELL